jgi:MFS family permease
MRELIHRTFRSLRVRNFRIFFIGQFVSSVGLWMQQVAELWLVADLTSSATAVGLITVAHFGPVLLFGLWGGVVADRLDKRRLLLVTQALLATIAAGLAIVSATGGVTVGILYGFAAATGLVQAVDNPARRAFIREMVDRANVSNAVSLVSMVFTSSRIVGPAITGVLLVATGPTIVFAVNALSYGGVLTALLLMRVKELHSFPPVPRAPGQLLEGLRYSWANTGVRLPLVMMVWIGTLAFNFTVLLVLFAEQTFDAGPGGYGTLLSLSAIGSLSGALVAAARHRITRRFLVNAAMGFGVVTVIASTAPTLITMALLLIPVGVFGVAFLSGSQGAMQEAAGPHMQGRVMALFAVVFLGGTPIGGMFAGLVSEVWGPRVAFAIGGAVSLATGFWAWRVGRSRIPAVEPAST